ncbi:PAS domain-containing sensor histidine kinase [Nitrincola tibetensis]|uniref:histidine kinase n=2 Tax=Nitrincola tibetensis TaxID=2219697 RepID=A0A364NMZ1_9GAMM|nr:PAS domain-containing sensor histidine kinase [Nitrincola tibetensis]
MRHIYLSCLLILISPLAQASLINYFKTADGRTNWQYIANFSSGVLIILLSVVVFFLFMTWRKAFKTNKELTLIRGQLEERVAQRTSALKASQAYLDDILCSLPLMLIGLDKNHLITQWNNKAEDISGVSREKALGSPLWDTYPTLNITEEHLNSALKSQEAIYIKQSQNGLYYFNITIYPLQNQMDAGVVILIDDVTQKILAENMLIHNDKMSSMGELAATMAHDINAPLQGILLDLSSFQGLLTSGQLMAENSSCGKEVQRLNHLLEDASEKGRNVTAIINNLLTFARQRSDIRQAADLTEITQHALTLAGDVLTSSKYLNFSEIRIEKAFDTNLPKVACYIIEMQQALLSLFRHTYDALIAARTTDPLIRIEINLVYDAIWIKIHHNGATLSDDEQMTLFEPFFSNPSDSGSEDMSKRLSFAHFIITEQHQGHIAVTSDPKYGTTFNIQLQAH